ncbi:Biotin-dependent carboxylase-like protein [Frankia canadensis]|uniref:Biotin-dependent carboxylase-like protein n=1 Tax=Frankia canadensis TaxID=1836972 RepID=A0A2I2KQY2_9ACTN|nr:biotin-dependent carboxyltransferase family protein [Frankia canadensis]SNQ48081.1 Biotin-dependent carboxylase-like protein [Frankia canadensis]SOU55371.1 Biotin-dependent carboxylase-like protein [Frankia canadensis]
MSGPHGTLPRAGQVRIIAPGPFATVQDLGRPGLAHLGVTRSGAADRHSLRLANRLVGNLVGAAAIELAYGGLVARFATAALIALTGAPCPLELAGRGVGMYAPIDVPAGALLRVGVPERGVRTYLAIRGGLDVPAVLGSRSTDTLAGLGPPALTAGVDLALAREMSAPPVVDLAPQARYPSTPTLRVHLGPRDDWFTDEARSRLWTTEYEVTASSDRVGVRLLGPALRRRITSELPSEGLVPGGIQVPPDGQPVIFLADHPVTGGYPVLGVVTARDIPLIAQCRPGQRVRLRPYRRASTPGEDGLLEGGDASVAAV